MSDTTLRDQLADIISHTENLTDEEGSWALPEDVADEIIRAGWRPPARTVSTVEDYGETIPARTVSKLKYGELIREFTKED